MLKTVSGVQAGVDRAALDAAIAHGVPCGGRCPGCRLAEDGPIPSRYPLRELQEGGCRGRTRQNVIDSDGTAIFCVEVGKPHLLIDAAEVAPGRAVELVRAFVAEFGVAVLNVAGPRASEELRAYPYALEVVGALLGKQKAEEIQA